MAASTKTTSLATLELSCLTFWSGCKLSHTVKRAEQHDTERTLSQRRQWWLDSKYLGSIHEIYCCVVWKSLLCLQVRGGCNELDCNLQLVDTIQQEKYRNWSFSAKYVIIAEGIKQLRITNASCAQYSCFSIPS
jgi:hypothetical protein